jgi:hypothetical protein
VRVGVTCPAFRHIALKFVSDAPITGSSAAFAIVAMRRPT